MTTEMNAILERLKALEQENAALKAARASKATIQIGDSGYVEVYGIQGKGRFSNSNTADGWAQVFAMKDTITEFCKANASELAKRQSVYQATRSNKASRKYVG